MITLPTVPPYLQAAISAALAQAPSVVTTASVTITVNGQPIATHLPARIDPTKVVGIVSADGRTRLAYHGTIAPPLALPENAFLVITDCPANPVFVDGIAMQIVNVRQSGTIPTTMFDLYRKVQP